MIKTLTSLRFVFALMVFFSHADLWKVDGSLMNIIYRDYLSEGFIGVGFFFVLSGFILSLNYSDKLKDGTVSSCTFWALRLVRIYPMYLLTLLLSVWFRIEDLNADTMDVVINFAVHALMLQSFIPYDLYSMYFNPPAWSISVEAFLYIAFPFIIPLLATTKKAVMMIGSLLLCTTLFIVLSKPGSLHFLFYINPLYRLNDFVLGMVLYLLYTRHKHFVMTRLQASMLEVGTVLMFALFVAFHHGIPIVYRYSVYYWLPIAAIIYVFALKRGFSRICFLAKLVFIWVRSALAFTCCTLS